MKRFIATVALGIFLLSALNAADLQKLFDAAASSPDKTLTLTGLHSLTAPVKLTQKHSGLSVVGDGTAVISGEMKIRNWQRTARFGRQK